MASGEVSVESQVHQIAKHAAGLRDAETERAPGARAPLRRQRISTRQPQTIKKIATIATLIVLFCYLIISGASLQVKYLEAKSAD